MGSERGANADFWKARLYEQKIGTAQISDINQTAKVKVYFEHSQQTARKFLQASQKTESEKHPIFYVIFWYCCLIVFCSTEWIPNGIQKEWKDKSFNS